ncbi:MAG: ABC-F family ATP-binding cassette domain-containing protein [Bacteroidota bacterium]
MITVGNLSVFFGSRELFSKIGFFIGPRERIGLVGKNGAGKSTLLKILAGVQNPSEGNVSITKGATIGYLPQEMAHSEDATVYEEAQSAFNEVQALHKRLDELGHEVANMEDYTSDDYSKKIEELEAIGHRLSILDSTGTDEKIERVLKGLGFQSKDFSRPMREFSGGWKMRVELGKLLLANPDLLLLDEPTNHLDIESIEWLEEFLDEYAGAVVLISHDRTFLDNVTKRTVEISKAKLYDYKFSYSKYLIQREQEIEKQEAAAKNQQKYIEDTQKLIDKFRAKKDKAAFAQTLIRKLDKLEKIEIDDFDSTKVKFTFPPAPHSGKIILEGKKLAKSYGDLHLFSDVNFTIARGEKVALIGKNGVGKSTLLKMTMKEEGFDGELQVGYSVNVGYYAQNQSDILDGDKTVFQTIDDEAVGEIRKNVRGLLGAFLFSGDDIDKKVKVLSGGEKARLAFCKLLLQPYNFLILDEPTNHLDLPSKEVLKKALARYDGTLLLVSHDRDFLDGLTDTVYEIQSDRMVIYPGTVKEFLKEKKAASIRLYEQNKIENQAKKEVKKKDANADVVVKIDKHKEKDLRKIETSIEKEEENLKQLEEELAKTDFAQQDAFRVLNEEYEASKKRLSALMQEWENFI